MCVRSALDTAGRTGRSRALNSAVKLQDEEPEMPCVRGRDEAQRAHQLGADEMALQVVRRIHHAKIRRHPEAAQAVLEMAAVEGVARRARDARQDVPADDVEVLVALAGAADLR